MSVSPRLYYGESILTSFRSYGEKVPGLNLHLKRLYEGVSEYYFESKLDIDSFNKHFDIEGRVASHLKGESDLYFRISLFQSSRSELLPKVFDLNELEVKIEVSPYVKKEKEALRLVVSHSPFSKYYRPLKSESYFQIFHEKRKAYALGFDDVLFNLEGELTEASTSGVVFVENGIFYTSNAKCILESVSMALFKAFCYRSGYKLISEKIDAIRIPSFESAFLLNSVVGAQSVCEINQNESKQLLKESDIIYQFKEFLGK